MRRALFIAAAIVGIALPVHAEQGPNYPSPGSDRGPAFPKSVSPTDSDPTNWVAPKTEYTDPSGPNARWNRWYGRRGWRR
jgi:hypothetical protein